MWNYFIGIATTLIAVTMYEIVDAGVPNDIWYWVSTYGPF